MSFTSLGIAYCTASSVELAVQYAIPRPVDDIELGQSIRNFCPHGDPVRIAASLQLSDLIGHHLRRAFTIPGATSPGVYDSRIVSTYLHATAFSRPGRAPCPGSIVTTRQFIV